VYKNKLTIPTKLINKHFTDENLKWCGWYENADELRTSDIEMKKTIYKVNKKHLMIVDKGDINIVTTITNIYN
jgi:hypothetical protein